MENTEAEEVKEEIVLDPSEKSEEEEIEQIEKNISNDDSPERMLLEKMEELKTADEEEIKPPNLAELFIALAKFEFQTVRDALASDETLKMQSTNSQKVSLGTAQMWIPNRSSLLHGAVRIAKVKGKLPLFDFILELIDMGANTNLTDAENKTVFDIYAEQFMSFDFKKFGLKDNNLAFRLSLQILKKLADKHCNQSSNSFSFFTSFMERGRSAWEGFSKEAELLYGEVDCLPKSPFSDELELDDSVKLADLYWFLQQRYPLELQKTLYCSYFYNKIDFKEKDENGKDLLTKLLANSAIKNLGTAIELLKLYDFDFRLLYQVDEKQVTPFGMVVEKVHETEAKKRAIPSAQGAQKRAATAELKNLNERLAQLKTIIAEQLAAKPHAAVQSIFNGEIVSHEKHVEQTAHDSVFDERIAKLEGKIWVLESENKKLAKAESEAKNHVRRVEAKCQSQDARIQNQEARIRTLEQEIQNLYRMCQSGQGQSSENRRPPVSGSHPVKSTTPNPSRNSLTPSRTVNKSPQAAAKSLMPQRPR